MILDNFLQLFVVKEKTFFPLYIAQAEIIVKASELLVLQTKEQDVDKRCILAKRIKECETEGDKITRTITDRLYVSYVTPFDREDILLLASKIDSFMDFIHDSAKKFAIYQPKTTDSKLTDIAQYILEDAKYLLEMTKSFENIRKDIQQMSKLCDKVKEIEHTVDDIYETYMSNLFRDEKDAIELVRKKNIVQALEDTTDQAKEVSDTIRSIIVKMS